MIVAGTYSRTNISRERLIETFGARRGRPWTAEEEARAHALRRLGLSDARIGELLKRSEASVARKLGYLPAPGRAPYVVHRTHSN